MLLTESAEVVSLNIFLKVKSMGEIQRDCIDRLLDTFWCHACLDDKPLTEQSPDPRYCKGCCEFLLQEARLIEGKRHPAWIPKVSPSAPEPFRETVESIGKCNKISESTSTRVRGRKPIDIPKGYIEKLVKEGITSCRRISERLKADYGIECSFMTVSRVIKNGGNNEC